MTIDVWYEHYIPEPNSGCWLWLGPYHDKGYGVVRPQGPTLYRAHRLMYELHCGPIPDGMSALHRCDNPCCVNPEHIFLGTQQDNMQDKARKGRAHRMLGHTFSRRKLTADDVAKIRASSERHWIIAERYGVSRGHISGIKAGKTW